jgi:hypothetical protein
MSATLIATGIPELDAALAAFDRKVQRKSIVTALKNALLIVKRRYQARVPVLSGAMRDAIVVKVPRGTKRGEIRRALMITRDSLARARRRVQKAGEKTLRKHLTDRVVAGAGIGRREASARIAAIRGANVGTAKSEDDFYPAFVELGDHDSPAKRPLRGAFYDSEQAIKAEFVNELKRAIASAGKPGLR